MLDEVEKLAFQGFCLLWLHPKSKRPIGNDWQEKPFRDADEMMATYKEGNNLGVKLGYPSDLGGGVYLHVIDMDVRKPELAEEAREKLHDLLPELDLNECPTVISGSGGESRHFYILTEEPFRGSKFAHSDGFAMVFDARKNRDVKKWDWELALMGTGQQVVLPPSIHPDTEQPYRWLREMDFDAVEAGAPDIIPTAALVRLIGDQHVERGDKAEPLGLDETEIKAILRDLPFDEWFEDRAGWWKIGMALHHEFRGDRRGHDIWCTFSRKSAKFNAKDADYVWKSFGKHPDRNPITMRTIRRAAQDERIDRALEDSIDDLGEEESKSTLFSDVLGELDQKPSAAQIKLNKRQIEHDLGIQPKWVQRLNRLHAVARMNSKTFILDFQHDGGVTYGPERDIHVLYANEMVEIGDKMMPISRAWMAHKGRRTYPNGIVFSPNQNVKGAYNHWQGWSVTPATTPVPALGCKLFLEHIRRVICKNNTLLYSYMIGWMAHLIQRPEDKPGVAVVYKGGKGAGKDTVFNYLGKLMSHHYTVIANQEQLTGRFNAHQEKVLLLHVEEGFWAGDKKGQSVLQHLITSEEMTIEPKGLNPFKVQSCLRLFISSNEEWIVPASADERRYFILEVSDGKIRDRAYFDALRAEMRGEGPSNLLAYLQQYDLKGFSVRDVPDTTGLGQQKIAGLKNMELWWKEVLDVGCLIGTNSEVPGRGVWEHETLYMSKSDLRDICSAFLRKQRFNNEDPSSVHFTRRLKLMLPSLSEKRVGPAGAQERQFVIPPLSVCRAEFAKAYKTEIEWDDEPVFRSRQEDI